MIWSQIAWSLFDGLLLCLLLHASVRNQEHYRFAPLPVVSALVAAALLAVNLLGRRYLSPYLLFAVAPLLVLPLFLNVLTRWCWLSRLKASAVLIVFFLIYFMFHCGREALSRQIRQTLEIQSELAERERQRQFSMEAPRSEIAEALSVSDQWTLEIQSWQRQRIEWSDLLTRLHPLLVMPPPELQVRRLAVSGQMAVREDWLARAGLFTIEAVAARMAEAHAARLRMHLEKSAPFRDLFEEVRATLGQAEEPGGETVARPFCISCRLAGTAPDHGWLRRGTLPSVLVRVAPYVLPPDAEGSFLPAARDAVTAAAAGTGVVLHGMRPYALSDGAGATNVAHILRAFTLKVEGRGGFMPVLRLLYRLEKSNPLLCVFNMTLESVPDSPEMHRVQLDLQWPVWSNRAVVEKVLRANGTAQVPPFRPAEPAPFEHADDLSDPFLPLGYSPASREAEALERRRQGKSEEQWQVAELLLKVTGFGVGADGEPYAIVNGEIKGKGDRLSVRAGGYEYGWTIAAVSRETGVRFTRLDVRMLDPAPGQP